MGAIAVGIDLGTTNSCVAVYDNGAIKIFENEDHTKTIPSWVSFTDDGILIGHEAKDVAHTYPRSTIFEVKRLIGQRYDDEKVLNDIKRIPYEIVNTERGLKIKVDYEEKTQEYFPEEISAFVLQKLKDLAKTHLNKDVTQVVVTVPAYFNEFQREATKFAAIIAGFKKVHIINEPTAAALAFNYLNIKRYRRNVLVYDFGGGTFDVSVVVVGGGKCKVKATMGNLHLGGTDIDFNLVNFIKDDFLQQYQEEIAESEAVMRRLKNSCEKIKHKLSLSQRIVQIELDNLSGKDYESSISREKFEEINHGIFMETLAIVEKCLGKSGLDKNEIDEVVLVGGSSRIPKVRELLREFFGEDKINEGVNPDEAVAFGAAIHAVQLMGDKSEVEVIESRGDKCEVEDVISLSLGVAEEEIFSSVIIPSNTPIPAKITKPYLTNRDNQKHANIIVYQGENSLIKDNYVLGNFILSNLREAPARSVRILVTFDIDEEGLLTVTASEDGKENEGTIKINVKKDGLTLEQLQEKTLAIENHREKELRRTEFFREKYNLEKLCHRVIGMGKKVKDNDERAAILTKCDDICEWLKNLSMNDSHEIHKKKDELLCITEKYSAMNNSLDSK